MAVTMTTGAVGGRSCEFAVALRDGNDTPVVTQVSMTVPVSIEDITAVLWLQAAGMEEQDWADTEYLRGLVAGSLLAEASVAIEAARLELAALVPGSEDHDFAMWIGQRARQLYAPMARQRSRTAATRRELAGVGS